LPANLQDAKPAWQGCVSSLVPLLAALGAHQADIAVTLSNRFARYFALPSSSALNAEPDWRAFAERRFEALFGTHADSCSILLSARSRSSRLACAVEGALIAAIRNVLETAGHRLASLRPQFAASFDLARRRIGAQDAWFVSQEPGHLTIGLAVAGDWRSVRQRRVGPDWAEQLPGILDREGQLAGLESQVPAAYVTRFDDHAPARLRLR
jgi:hypothetical protein